MRCPDCGGELKLVSVTGFDDSWNCSKCGGYWLANWVVNNVADGKPLRVEPKNLKKAASGGLHSCPTDATTLTAAPEEMKPEGVEVGRCHLCGGWWFPGDSLFTFRRGYETKKEYMKAWKMPEWSRFAWPALALAVLVTGLGVTVNLVRQRTQMAVPAASMLPVSDFVVAEVEPGKVVIWFKSSEAMDTIEYKKETDTEWVMMLVAINNGGYMVDVQGLESGATYQVRIVEQEFTFMAK